MAMQSYKTNALIEKIQFTATQVRSLYKKGDYSEIGKDNAAGANMLIESGKVTNMNNPFGGTLGLMHSNWPNAFDIHVRGDSIPAETCVELLQTDWGDSGVFEGVNLKGSRGGALRYSNGKWPVSLSDAVTYCKNGNISIDLVFR